MTRPAADPRNTSTYRHNRRHTRNHSDICHICHHPGAHSVDHIISVEQWLQTYGTLTGVNDPSNLAPAHGLMGPRRPPNRCPVCQLLCNQGKGGARGKRQAPASPRSQVW